MEEPKKEECPYGTTCLFKEFCPLSHGDQNVSPATIGHHTKITNEHSVQGGAQNGPPPSKWPAPQKRGLTGVTSLAQKQAQPAPSHSQPSYQTHDVSKKELPLSDPPPAWKWPAPQNRNQSQPTSVAPKQPMSYAQSLGQRPDPNQAAQKLQLQSSSQPAGSKWPAPPARGPSAQHSIAQQRQQEAKPALRPASAPIKIILPQVQTATPPETPSRKTATAKIATQAGAQSSPDHSMTPPFVRSAHAIKVTNGPAMLASWRKRMESFDPIDLSSTDVFQMAFALFEASKKYQSDIVSALLSANGLRKISQALTFDWNSKRMTRFKHEYSTVISPLIQLLAELPTEGPQAPNVQKLLRHIGGSQGTYCNDFFEAAIRYMRLYDTVTSSDIMEQFCDLTAAYALVIQVATPKSKVMSIRYLVGDLKELAGSFAKTQHVELIRACRENIDHASKHIGDSQQRPRGNEQVWSPSPQLLSKPETPHQQAMRSSVSVASVPSPISAPPKRTGHLQTSIYAGISVMGTADQYKLPSPGQNTDSRSQQKHDNDYKDIVDINVLPTRQELRFQAEPVLPLLDPTTWSKAGLAGLLDRHFRLLREDCLLSIKERVGAEMKRKDRKHAPTSDQSLERCWSYTGVVVEDSLFKVEEGLQMTISFDQVRHNGSSVAFWERSGRLQPDTAVCIVVPHKAIIFCTVKHLPRGSQKFREMLAQQRKMLYGDVNRAFLRVTPVQSHKETISGFLELIGSDQQSASVILIEFPGVLLQGFVPTLRALQEMAKSHDVPFREYLAPAAPPTSGVFAITPPAYASSRNFKYDLSPVCDRGQRVFLAPYQPAGVAESLCRASKLDRSQAETVVDALTRQFALIQGPPGTGKSYVGVALIKILVAARMAHRLGPIICVCYTNHALDQLLEHLLDTGIQRIVRVGAGSLSERLEEFNLNVLADKMPMDKREKENAKVIGKDMKNTARLQGEALARLKKAHLPSTLRDYLMSCNRAHGNQLFAPHIDTDGFRTKQKRDPGALLQSWLSGGSKKAKVGRSITELQSIHLDHMTNAERTSLHKSWVDDMTTADTRTICELAPAFEAYNEKWKVFTDSKRLRTLLQADVIGLTTSGMASRLGLLKRLGARVLICEEAGEVLEAHLLATLMPSIEHAILIGDHFQLRPQVEHHLSRESSRGEQYAFDMSLFERLVTKTVGTLGTLPLSTLNTQRRMHPEISELVRKTLYPSLEDGAKPYPKVPGMKERLFWMDHNNPESSNHGGQGPATSKRNIFEVNMVAALTSYLIKQCGRRKDEIAVITPYLGQMQAIRAKLSSMTELVIGERDLDSLQLGGFIGADEREVLIKKRLSDAVTLATVDTFQGEEANIVIISMVRSNTEGNCGFLKTSNRINVLLSRAKHGMYVIGNVTTYIRVPMWAEVLEILEGKEQVGPAFELMCDRHPNNIQCASTPEDFKRIAPSGGCQLQCELPMKCGHRCHSTCHSQFLHDSVQCMQPCLRHERVMAQCGHPSPKRCCDPCPEVCIRMVTTIELPCGHKSKIPETKCFQASKLKTSACSETKTMKLPRCGHEVELPCHIRQVNLDYQCREKCGAPLECGHECQQLCAICKPGKQKWGENPPTHLPCARKCGASLPGCDHHCEAQCHGGDPCPPCNKPCSTKCPHEKCQNTCSALCLFCEKDCVIGCKHAKCSLSCAAPCDWVPCSLRCERHLDCGHQCPSLCGETCPPASFCQVCGSTDIKETEVDLQDWTEYGSLDLTAKPCIFLDCGHFFTVEAMDRAVKMETFYRFDADGRPDALQPHAKDLTMELTGVGCPTCNEIPLSKARYALPVRIAGLVATATKLNGFNLAGCGQLSRSFAKAVSQLGKVFTSSVRLSGDLNLYGPSKEIVKIVARFPTLVDRYDWLLALNDDLHQFSNLVEGSFWPVQRRVSEANENSGLPRFTLETLKGHQSSIELQASCLRSRIALVLLTDFLALPRQEGLVSMSCVQIDTRIARQECTGIMDKAKSIPCPVRQMEGHIFWICYALLELNFTKGEVDSARQDDVRKEMRVRLTRAQKLGTKLAGSAAAMNMLHSAENLTKTFSAVGMVKMLG